MAGGVPPASEIPAEADEIWPPGKTFGELAPAQKKAATRRAFDQLQAELTAAAPAISKVMDEALDGEPLVPSVATEQTIAALGDLAAGFKVESAWNEINAAPLREAKVRTVIRVTAPVTVIEDAVTALRMLPGIVQLSVSRSEAWIYRR